jgi:hypothetical protein
MAKLSIELSGYIEDSHRISMDNFKMLRKTASGILLDPYSMVRVSAYQEISTWSIDLFAFDTLLRPVAWKYSDPFEGMPAQVVKNEIAERVIDMYKRREIFQPLQTDRENISNAIFFQVVQGRTDVVRFCSQWCKSHESSLNEEEVKKILINNSYSFWKDFYNIRIAELKKVISQKPEELIRATTKKLFKDNGEDFLEWMNKRGI